MCDPFLRPFGVTALNRKNSSIAALQAYLMQHGAALRSGAWVAHGTLAHACLVGTLFHPLCLLVRHHASRLMCKFESKVEVRDGVTYAANIRKIDNSSQCEGMVLLGGSSVLVVVCKPCPGTLSGNKHVHGVDEHVSQAVKRPNPTPCSWVAAGLLV